MSYEDEMRAFAQLKSGMSDAAADEFVAALEVLHSRFNTTIRENRFIVGGALELFMHALLLSSGVMVQPHGPVGTGGDFVLTQSGTELSLKSEFTPGRGGQIGLVNKQGGGDRQWETATLFVFSEVGILYCDPSMVPAGSVKDQGDQISISRRIVEAAAEEERFRIEMPIPTKQPTMAAGKSERASRTVALEILRSENLDHLAGALISAL